MKMAKKDMKKTAGVDDIKLIYLKNRLKDEKIRKPTREDVSRILGVGYVQAGNYLRVIKGA